MIKKSLKINLPLLFIIVSLGLVSCQTNNSQSNVISINFKADTLPKLFLENTISTGKYERDLAISTDRKKIVYTISSPKPGFSALVEINKTESGYSKPKLISFSGIFSDLEPFFSPDGHWLYFASNRPLEVNGTEPKPDFDIWRAKVLENGYGQPENLGEPINTFNDEFFPSVAASGNIYYTAYYEFGHGKEDIYVAKKITENSYDYPQPLSEAVNSPVYEFNAYVSPDENLILFTSFGRNLGPGGGDLYYSTKSDSGTWQPAKLLNHRINSNKLDFCPFYDVENKTLYFTSERTFFKGIQPFTNIDSLSKSLNAPQNGLADIYHVIWQPVD